MAQQDTDQQHAGVLPVDDEGFVVDTEDTEERENAWRERGTSRPITVVGNPVLHKECKDVTEFGAELDQLVADMFASQRTAEGARSVKRSLWAAQELNTLYVSDADVGIQRRFVDVGRHGVGIRRTDAEVTGAACFEAANDDVVGHRGAAVALVRVGDAGHHGG